MNLTNTVGITFVISVLMIVAAALYARNSQINRTRACEEKNGIYLRTADGNYVCIDRKSMVPM